MMHSGWSIRAFRGESGNDWEEGHLNLYQYIAPVSYTHLDVYKRQVLPDFDRGYLKSLDKV